MVCIGNTGELHPDVVKAIEDSGLVASAVLSGNRNFEGRIHALTKANYLASPALVIAYSLAGTVDIDFEKEPLGKGKDGKDVFLKDIWPSRATVKKAVAEAVNSEQFTSNYAAIAKGTDAWNALKVEGTKTYTWKDESTYIHNPPYFAGMTMSLNEIKDIKGAYCLLNMGDFITTDHISPAGAISPISPAARFLNDRKI